MTDIGVSLPAYPWLPGTGGWDESKAWIGKHCDVVGMPMPYWEHIEPVRGQWDATAEFAALDRIVDEARSMGLKVFLFMSPWPAWASERHRARRGGKVNVTPDVLIPGGSWAYYLYEVLKHYAGRVDWVAPLNEVNFEFMDDPDTMAADTATMVEAAAWIAQYIPHCPMLLVPAVLDADVGGQSNWHTFTEAFLKALGKSWRPPHGVRVGFALHSYADIEEGCPLPGKPPRTQAFLDLLAEYDWCDGRNVYMTEGGFQFAVKQTAPKRYDYADPAQMQTQAEHLARAYAWATGRMEPKINGRVVLAQNWEYQDLGNIHWRTGLVSPDGAAHPIVSLWEKARSRPTASGQSEPTREPEAA